MAPLGIRPLCRSDPCVVCVSKSFAIMVVGGVWYFINDVCVINCY